MILQYWYTTRKGPIYTMDRGPMKLLFLERQTVLLWVSSPVRTSVWTFCSGSGLPWLRTSSSTLSSLETYCGSRLLLSLSRLRHDHRLDFIMWMDIVAETVKSDTTRGEPLRIYLSSCPESSLLTLEHSLCPVS